MQITYLKFMQKWLATYKGKPVGVGNSIAEAITNALEAINNK